MYAVQMQGIVKRFAGMAANDSVDFDLEQGEIHALLGENGAGKTTLMRILYGLYRPDDGRILVGGKIAAVRSPKNAIQYGIGMVTQHFTLAPTLTVAENLALGQSRQFLLDKTQMSKDVERLSARFGILVDPNARVGHLSVGEQQRVEILKALSRDTRVLILDEPTAVLVPQEVALLFEVLKRLSHEGLSVVFISHKLNEVMTICNRITVLRDGKVVGNVDKHDTNRSELARLMIGRTSLENRGLSLVEGGLEDESIKAKAAPRPESVLQVASVSVTGKAGFQALKKVSFDIHAGEILGLAGVSGNGQFELAQILSGTLKPGAGKVVLMGKDVTSATPGDLTLAGVGRIPEDRRLGVIPELSVAENLMLDHIGAFVKNGILDTTHIQENARELIETYQIKASPQDRTRTLSGGNMQKVILARILSRNPRVVIAAQPTRGLDMGAASYVRAKLLEQRARGAGVLLISEDLDEIMALSDRIAVIYEGQIMGILPAVQVNLDQLGLMMSGHTLESILTGVEQSNV
jgi:ABC-type uncharacterized transport system ATPase subunit